MLEAERTAGQRDALATFMRQGTLSWLWVVVAVVMAAAMSTFVGVVERVKIAVAVVIAVVIHVCGWPYMSMDATAGSSSQKVDATAG